jgi:transposase
VKLLSDYRRDLVAQRTRIASQLRWRLHELDSDLVVPPRGFRRTCVVDQLDQELRRFEGVVARLARSLLDRCRDLNAQIKTLEAEPRVLVTRLGPSLLAVPGCGVLSGAVIIGETGGVHRFRNKDAFARFTGTAPVPVWSGAGEGKVRLTRGGNRAMNCALRIPDGLGPCSLAYTRKRSHHWQPQ